MIAPILVTRLRQTLPRTPQQTILATVLVLGALALSKAEDRSIAQGGRVPLRVLTLNMYGLRYPPRLGWMADESDCAERFRAVGRRIRYASPPYDIVAVQELYRAPDLHIITCDPAPFLEALEQTGEGFGRLRLILFSPKGEAWKGEVDGGIGLLTPHSVEESEAVRFAGSGGPFFAARGFIFARIRITESNLKVDAYVVHLSPGRQNSEQRKRELETLSKAIAEKSSASGNPVLVLGDFNIAGPPVAGSEYATILRQMGHPRDLWLENGAPDSGFTYDCFGNAVASLRGCDYEARIDYVWIVTDPRLSQSDYEVNASQGGGVRKVEWYTDGPKPLPVSDHFGVEASLWIERKGAGMPLKGPQQ